MPEKAELAKGNADQDDGERPKQCNDYYINDYPDCSLFDSENAHQFSAHIACETAANGKCAEDEGQLQAIDLPFSL